jgi:predicted Zn finger-like uncharacterized protein
MPVSIKCPQCARGLRVPDELIGRKVKCPGCSTSFTADPAGGEAPAAPPPADDGGYEAPRRSAGSSDAAARVKAPAIALLCFGIFGIFWGMCNLGFSIFSMVAGNAAMAGPGGPPGGRLGPGGPGRAGPGPGDDFSSQIGGIPGAIQGFIGMCVAGLIIFSAIKMKNLQAYGLAMTGSILAMIPCISPCCFLGLPFGIWALVILMNQDVKAAFQ